MKTKKTRRQLERRGTSGIFATFGRTRAGGLAVVLAAGLGSCGGEKGDPGDPGPAGAMGDKGDPGGPGDSGGGSAAISLLTPPSLYAGRTALLQISGVGTHFASGTTLDFADSQINATQVQAGSADNLRVVVQVGLAALMGGHDVMVMSPASPTGGTEEHVILSGGFTVLPALSAELPTGVTAPLAVPQGGIVDVSVTNLDARDNPFDNRTTPGPQLSLGLVSMSSPTLMPDHFEGLGLVDALAPKGGLRVALVQKDRQGQDIGYASDPADKSAPQVTARPAVQLTPGTTQSGEVLATAQAGLRTTNLYKITTSADNQVALLAFSGLGSALSTAGGVSLNGYLAPASGMFRDGHSLETSETPGLSGTASARNTLVLLPKAGDFYFAVYASDLSSSPNHGYALLASLATAASLTSLKEPTPADSTTMPLASIASLDKPYYGLDGAVDTGFDEDFIRFKASKTGRVYAILLTTPGLSLGLSLRGADCTTIVSANRYSASGNVLNEGDVTKDMTYCARITGTGQPAPYQFIISQALN